MPGREEGSDANKKTVNRRANVSTQSHLGRFVAAGLAPGAGVESNALRRFALGHSNSDGVGEFSHASVQSWENVLWLRLS